MKKFMYNIAFIAMIGLFQLICLAVLMRTPLFAGMAIYYYRVLAIVAVDALLTVGVILLFRKKLIVFNLDFSNVFSAMLSTLSIIALFVTLTCLCMDRSYTIFSLADMSQNTDTIYSEQDIQDKFIETYIIDYGSTTKRIEEQVSIGNVEVKDGGYIITKKGRFTIALFRLIEIIFPVSDKRILYPNQCLD